MATPQKDASYSLLLLLFFFLLLLLFFRFFLSRKTRWKHLWNRSGKRNEKKNCCECECLLCCAVLASIARGGRVGAMQASWRDEYLHVTCDQQRVMGQGERMALFSRHWPVPNTSTNSWRSEMIKRKPDKEGKSRRNAHGPERASLERTRRNLTFGTLFRDPVIQEGKCKSDAKKTPKKKVLRKKS